MKTAAQAAQNWEQSAPRASQAYQDGVNNYSGDWANATISQRAVLVQNFNAALNRGDWDRGVQAVGTQGWKSRTQAKIQNYSTGFTAGAQRQAAAIAKIVQAEQNIVPNLPPRGDYNANKQRASAFMDAMHALKGQLGAT